MEEVDDYEATINWATQEETLRATRGQGYGSFYLIIASILILLFCLLILYYTNRGNGKKKTNASALDLIQDENNIYLEEFSNVEENDVNEDDNDDDEVENNDKAPTSSTV
jgi:hypothetical protein